jgi:RnfABCDGE-type electron transport complex G subunit
MTKDTIEEQKAQAALAAYRAVIPGAEDFEKVDAVDELNGEVYGSGFGRVYINEAVIGLDANGNQAGYAVSATSAEGYDGNVTVSVGIDTNGAVTSVSFTELHETPGKGMLCAEPSFIDQFSGKAVSSFKLLKSGGSTADNEIDGVSGATITSSAVTNAVNAALDFYNNAMRGE